MRKPWYQLQKKQNNELLHDQRMRGFQKCGDQGQQEREDERMGGMGIVRGLGQQCQTLHFGEIKMAEA